MVSGIVNSSPPAALTRRAVLAAPALLAGRARAADTAPVVVPARDVRNGWGVCGRPGSDATPEAYGAMMRQIGTRDLRTYLGVYGANAAERLRPFAQSLGEMPRVTALVTAYLNDPTSWEQQQRQLLAFVGSGMLRAIEGPNEVNQRLGNGTHGPDDLINHSNPADYPANYLAWARAIDGFVKSNAARFRGVTVVAPCIASGRQADYARLPDVSAFVDAGNMHFYAGRGLQPSFSMGVNPPVGYFDNIRRWAQAAQAPGKPVWMTECGATTSANFAADGVLSYTRDGVSQAKYLANQIFDYFVSGGQRMFIYHLVDSGGRAGNTEGNLGLFRSDGTPKPAALMLARLKHILSLGRHEDGRNARDTQSLTPGHDARTLTVTGLTTPSQAGPGWLVMPKSDGGTVIALWNEPPVDDGHGASLEPREAAVTLEFGSMQSFRVHDLMAEAPPGRPVPGRGTTVGLRGYPMLVELLPGGRG